MHMYSPLSSRCLISACFWASLSTSILQGHANMKDRSKCRFVKNQALQPLDGFICHVAKTWDIFISIIYNAGFHCFQCSHTCMTCSCRSEKKKASSPAATVSIKPAPRCKASLKHLDSQQKHDFCKRWLL